MSYFEWNTEGANLLTEYRWLKPIASRRDVSESATADLMVSAKVMGRDWQQVGTEHQACIGADYYVEIAIGRDADSYIPLFSGSSHGFASAERMAEMLVTLILEGEGVTGTFLGHWSLHADEDSRFRLATEWHSKWAALKNGDA